MLNKSFKIKILSIFFVPAVALIYFSFYFVSIRYEQLNNTSALMLSSKITKSISKFVHNLQIERGLSAGYIVSKNQSLYKKRLLQQRKLTDQSYKDFLYYVNLQTKEKEKVKQMIYYKNDKNIKKVLCKLHKLKHIRESILQSKMTFKGVMKYYTGIDEQLIEAIHVLSSLFHNKNINPSDIYKLEELKESAGEERAYIYSSLLCKKMYHIELEIIRDLIVAQKQYKNDFLANSSIPDLALYNKIVSYDTELKVEKYRVKFFDRKLSQKDAKQWFAVSSSRINEIESLNIKIINLYLDYVTHINQQAKKSLIITFLLWVLSLGAFLTLLYILNKLIDQEVRLIDDLRVASYAFDAHEAMTVTDPNGKIIRVNKAFTKITGYSPEEVIGKNPRVLKSYKHSEEFYKNMWKDLHTKGYWSDEIYNKRKNGEIYVEKLSITAIKDKNDITTHYIAQFLDITELKSAQKQALYQATHDFLTKLPNKKMMVERLKKEFSRSQRHGFYNSFLFIDLDGFKQINDNFGHQSGDKLLIKVAERLKSCVREEDFVSRIGGDEFAIILLDLGSDYEKSIKNTQIICEKIIEKLTEHFSIDGHTIDITSSIGVRIFPNNIKDINDIINQADMAMYKAKENGKNRFVFYDKIC